MLRNAIIPLVLAALAGCSSRPEPVTGTVTLEGVALTGAAVEFLPVGETRGLGGTAMTTADGTFTLEPKRGGDMPVGGYRVVISKPLRKDGTAPPPDVPPIESDASESLPGKYSDRDQSELRAVITPEQRRFEFKLEKAAP